MKAYKKILEKSKEIVLLGSAAGLVGWDLNAEK